MEQRRSTASSNNLDSLAADPLANERTLVARLTPVVRARAARVIGRAGGRTRDRVQHIEVEDLTQDVLCALFAERGRILSNWECQRGLSFSNYVGLVAERLATRTLHSCRSAPSRAAAPTSTPAHEAVDGAPNPEEALAQREVVSRLLERMYGKLSPRGRELFHHLIIEEQPISRICSQFGLSCSAAYAWRSRLWKLVRSLDALGARAASGK